MTGSIINAQMHPCARFVHKVKLHLCIYSLVIVKFCEVDCKMHAIGRCFASCDALRRQSFSRRGDNRIPSLNGNGTRFGINPRSDEWSDACLRSSNYWPLEIELATRLSEQMIVTNDDEWQDRIIIKIIVRIRFSNVCWRITSQILSVSSVDDRLL